MLGKFCSRSKAVSTGDLIGSTVSPCWFRIWCCSASLALWRPQRERRGHPTPVLALRIPLLILTWWINLALGAKRLHDRDLSAWFLLLAVVPIIGWVWFLYQAVQPGTAGDNRFGPDPLADEERRVATVASGQPMRSANASLGSGQTPNVLSIVAGIVILALAGGAAWFYENNGASLVGDATKALSPASDGLAWDVGYQKGKLDPQLEADATHDIDGGGQIEIAATCDSSSDASNITLAFSYFSKYDKGDGAASSYDTEGSGNFEHVPIIYRIDNGESQQANSQTQYKNSANVVFAYISPNAKGSGDAAGDMAAGLMIGLTKMFGGIQDLKPFLHAHEVDFQLPLGGGGSEIVKINPQDSNFQSFVSQCKIDIGRIDAEVAKQKADEKAADDQKAQEQAVQQQQQQDGSTAPPYQISRCTALSTGTRAAG